MLYLLERPSGSNFNTFQLQERNLEGTLEGILSTQRTSWRTLSWYIKQEDVPQGVFVAFPSESSDLCPFHLMSHLTATLKGRCSNERTSSPSCSVCNMALTSCWRDDPPLTCSAAGDTAEVTVHRWMVQTASFCWIQTDFCPFNHH